jgi:hypothetical protein
MMTDTQWQRLSALTGIAFAILMWVAFSIQGVLPQADDSQADVVEYFSTYHNDVMGGVVLRVAAGIFFLWFIGTLRSVLAAAEGGTGRLANVAFGAGLLMLAAGMGAMASLASIAYNAERGVDPSFAGSMMAMTHLFFVGGAMGMAWLLFATALVVFRTRVFSRWVASTGVVIGLVAIVLGIVAPAGTSGVSAYPLFILWVVALSILMAREDPGRGRMAARTAAEVPEA